MARTASSIHDFKKGTRVRLAPESSENLSGTEGTVVREAHEVYRVRVLFDKGCSYIADSPEEVELVSDGLWEIGARARSLVNYEQVHKGDEGVVEEPPRRACTVHFLLDNGDLWTLEESRALRVMEILEPGEKLVAGMSASSPQAPAKAQRKRNRWGHGLDAPAAGAREYFPNGWTPARDVYAAIQVFGHSSTAIGAIKEKGEKIQRELAMLDLVIPPDYTSVVFSYTQEDDEFDLYGKLNAACRTSGFLAEKKIALYRDFMYHLQEAVTTLPNFYGRVFRGIDCKVSPVSYATGKRITWQGFASTSKLQQEARRFLSVQKGQLSGSLFICDVKNGKEIDSLSDFPEEQEVLLKPNTFFNVVGKLEGEAEKKGALEDLAGYGMEDLEVYVLKQV